MKQIRPTDLIIKPLDEAETLPSEWYTDPDVFRIERDAIFARSWQLAVHQSRLTEHGCRVPIDIADEPLIVVRDGETVRAMFNVCRHRGGPLAVDAGCASNLRCLYHGWTYNLDGTLKATPDFDNVSGFDKKDIRLPQVLIQEWQGFYFIRLEDGSPSLSELLSGIAERAKDVLSPDLRYHCRETYRIKCNWKLYIDNYLEGYHVPIVHPELVKLYDYRSYRTEVRKWYSFQHSPIADKENIYSSGGGEALYYFVWPNLMLNILPGRLQTNHVYPVDAENCLVHFDYYYPPDADTNMIRNDIEFSHRVQHEDIDICERVQRGVASRSYRSGRFSVNQEEAVWHFQNLVKSTFRQMI